MSDKIVSIDIFGSDKEESSISQIVLARAVELLQVVRMLLQIQN